MMDQLIAPGAGEDEVANWVKRSRTIESVTRIPGDASTRRYYRVQAEGKSYIIMRMEEGFSSSGMNFPFIVVQRHLAEAGVDVPRILDIDPERGFILLEDLGDVTLLRHLQGVSSAEVERHLYEKVIDSLVTLQVNASPERKPADIEAYRLRFDHEKLLWEMNNTVEHFYEIHLKRVIRPEDRRTMNEGFSEICTILSNEPTVLAHRDFHSRNIMLKDDRLVMIDFQDARLGPPQYDLASLLRDCYYQLEEAQIDRLVDYYIARWEASTGNRLDRKKFRQIFDLMSVQRNFKAIGSFASFMNRRGDPGYLKYIGNTFENIRRNLLKYPRYSSLREVLFHYYYF
jgi:aminoglycoside/choline kinase family phosphotransferase